MEALERLGFTGFVSNKSFLPFVFGAGGGTRTHTLSPGTDFESVTSTIPSRRHVQALSLDIILLYRFLSVLTRPFLIFMDVRCQKLCRHPYLTASPLENGIELSSAAYNVPPAEGVGHMEKTVRMEAGRRVSLEKRGQKAALGKREKRRLLQLAACLFLFLTVFFAKGVDRLEELRDHLNAAICADTDFRGAFADLGWSVAAGRPIRETLGELWVDVIMPSDTIAVETIGGGDLYRQTLKNLEKADAAPVSALVKLDADSVRTDPMESSVSRIISEVQQEQEAEPAVGHVEYTGPALPDNTTMDRYALGLEKTVTPVMGTLSSDFGWREHPIDGEEKFHCGVDLAVETGTPVLAFAAGTVDYIGESDIYGEYLQLRHANGVTSFYAHCSKLCVQQGQTVAAGEKVAESGATGRVTGPHLHFEIKKNGIRLEPLYYIQTLS